MLLVREAGRNVFSENETEPLQGFAAGRFIEHEEDSERPAGGGRPGQTINIIRWTIFG